MRTARRSQGLLEYKWIVLINTTIGVLMSAIDTSVITIALPDITHALHASVVEVMWVVMGYSLVITSLLLPFARLADMKGRVGTYNLGFAIFTVASACCGFAQSGLQLDLFRLVQGVGAAFLFANSTALLTDAFPASQRGLALSVNQVALNAGFILGTVVGGVITEYFGWRYIFFINIPFGVFATAWAYLRLREIVEPERKARFDVGGMVTFPLAMASILGACTLVVLGRAGDVVTNTLFVAGILLLVAFLFFERRVHFPMMDLSLFRIRLFWAGNASLWLNAIARGATMFIMSWYFQAVLEDSPVVAGLKILPMVCPMLLVAPLAGRLADRFGSRLLAPIGLMFTFVAQVWIMTFSVHVPYVAVAISLALLGCGNGLFNSPNTRAVMGSVPPNRRGVAGGFRTLLNNSGRTMSIAVAMVILSTTMSYQLLAALFTGTATGGESVHGLAFMDGFHKVFLLSAIISAIAIVCSSLRGTEDEAGKPSTATAEARAARADVPLVPSKAHK